MFRYIFRRTIPRILTSSSPSSYYFFVIFFVPCFVFVYPRFSDMLGDFPSTPNIRLVRFPMKLPCSRKSTSAPSAAKILETGSPPRNDGSRMPGCMRSHGLKARHGIFCIMKHQLDKIHVELNKDEGLVWFDVFCLCFQGSFFQVPCLFSGV